ncbi:hypothetical protein GW17_00056831 [Ensete ventricosum]|nr:hypothetical protein GW17_00056831 [Ensete ventricosum]
MRFTYFLGEIISQPREDKTSLVAARLPLISLSVKGVRGHFYFQGLSSCSSGLLVSRSPKIARLQSCLSDQDGMTSSSSTTSGFTSAPSSLSIPSPRAGGRRSSGTKSGWSEPCSSSLGVITRTYIKAFQALEVMKSCHDFDSTLTVESLIRVWNRYSIPDEYALHAPSPRQHPYDAYPRGFCISFDALEAGLTFSLHPVVGECLRWLLSNRPVRL